MKKTTMTFLVIIILSLLASIVIIEITKNTTQTLIQITPQPKTQQYLHYTSNYREGNETKVYLIDSTLDYGVYSQSIIRLGATGSYSIEQGDLCIIINGTIENHYDTDYYFSLTAEVINSDGDTVEPVLTEDSPHPGFIVVFVEKDASGYFEMKIKYDFKDITQYDLFVAFEPYDTPPP